MLLVTNVDGIGLTLYLFICSLNKKSTDIGNWYHGFVNTAGRIDLVMEQSNHALFLTVLATLYSVSSINTRCKIEQT